MNSEPPHHKRNASTTLRQTRGPQTQRIKDFHCMPGYLIRRTQQISTALFADQCAAYDLTAVQYAALVAIGLNPQVDATRISRLTSLDRSTLGNVLERIEAKGLVLRRPSPVDRRAKLLSLSAKGRMLLADVESSVQQVQGRLLEPLNSRERELFVTLLCKLTDSHKDVAPVKC